MQLGGTSARVCLFQLHSVCTHLSLFLPPDLGRTDAPATCYCSKLPHHGLKLRLTLHSV